MMIPYDFQNQTMEVNGCKFEFILLIFQTGNAQKVLQNFVQVGELGGEVPGKY